MALIPLYYGEYAAYPWNPFSLSRHALASQNSTYSHGLMSSRFVWACEHADEWLMVQWDTGEAVQTARIENDSLCVHLILLGCTLIWDRFDSLMCCRQSGEYHKRYGHWATREPKVEPNKAIGVTRVQYVPLLETRISTRLLPKWCGRWLQRLAARRCNHPCL